MNVAEVRFRGTCRNPDRRSLQNERLREGDGDLKFVPAPELDPMLQRDVKTKDGRACLQREENRTLFGDIPGAAGPVDGKSPIASVTDFAGHFRQGPEASARARAA